MLTKVIDDLLAGALLSRNRSFDPVGALQWELGETDGQLCPNRSAVIPAMIGSPAEVDDCSKKTDSLTSRGSIGKKMTPVDASQRQILLIDDDRDMAEMLSEYLSPEGYAVHLAYNARTGLERIKEGGLVLIILDVMLPDRDGFSVLKEIRQTSRIPIIMLTTRTAIADKVSGLEAGADDYVPKPFTPVELLARIHTVLRRGQPSRFGSSFVSLEDLILDAGSRTVECKGAPIECTAAEFDVLHALVSSAGEVVTRERLSRLALGRDPYAGDRGIDNLVSALRKKLGPGPNGRDRIRSVRGIGYVYLQFARRGSPKERR